MAYYGTQLTAPIGIGCTSCATSGLGSYPAWAGRTRMPSWSRVGVPGWSYPQAGLGGPIAVSGLGADSVAPAPTPSPATTQADAERASAVGKGLFLGAAYGIAIGMIASELMRKNDAAAQLKQNRKLTLLSALFGSAVGALVGVQAPTPQA